MPRNQAPLGAHQAHPEARATHRGREGSVVSCSLETLKSPQRGGCGLLLLGKTQQEPGSDPVPAAFLQAPAVSTGGPHPSSPHSPNSLSQFPSSPHCHFLQLPVIPAVPGLPEGCPALLWCRVWPWLEA